MQLENIIVGLLEEKGRAAVPGWGVLECHPVPAYMSLATHTFFPGGMKISFEENGRVDHQLVTVVAKKLGGQIDAAEAWIRRKVNGWQTELNQQKLLVLEGLGSFNKEMEFTQDVNATLNPDLFGLSPVHLFELSQPSAIKKGAMPSLKVVKEDRGKRLVAWRRAAVAASVAAMLSLGYFQSDLPAQMAGWSHYVDPASWNVTWPWSGEDVPVETTTEVSTASAPITAPFEEAVEEVITEEVVAEEVVVSSVQNTTTTTAAATYTGTVYHIIVGSFADPSNATNLSAELTDAGFTTTILPGHLDKVSVGQYTNRDEAATALKSIKRNVEKHAWIYAK